MAPSYAMPCPQVNGGHLALPESLHPEELKDLQTKHLYYGSNTFPCRLQSQEDMQVLFP